MLTLRPLRRRLFERWTRLLANDPIASTSTPRKTVRTLFTALATESALNYCDALASRTH
jgi:hypothetical protein